MNEVEEEIQTLQSFYCQSGELKVTGMRNKTVGKTHRELIKLFELMDCLDYQGYKTFK